MHHGTWTYSSLNLKNGGCPSWSLCNFLGFLLSFGECIKCFYMKPAIQWYFYSQANDSLVTRLENPGTLFGELSQNITYSFDQFSLPSLTYLLRQPARKPFLSGSNIQPAIESTRTLQDTLAIHSQSFIINYIAPENDSCSKAIFFSREYFSSSMLYLRSVSATSCWCGYAIISSKLQPKDIDFVALTRAHFTGSPSPSQEV